MPSYKSKPAVRNEQTNDMRTLSAGRRLIARGPQATIAAMICAAMIAACGSSRPPNGTRADGGPLLEYARCIRAHGVPNFPDPGTAGGLVIPNDINPQSPAFESAQQGCRKLAQAPEGPTGSSESSRLRLVALARCMRSHGVPSFADPTSSPPPPSSANVLGGNGSYLALGTPQERQSPAYKRAATACGGL
jgi:hypothetical protein